MALTKIQCDRAVCPPKKAMLRFADEHGMHLEVAPAGSKYWRLRYRFAGKEKLLALGVYPEVTMVEARDRRDQARGMLREGQDPTQVRRDKKQKLIEDTANTFEIVARLWFEHWSGPKNQRHAQYVMSRLEADVFPVIGKPACAAAIFDALASPPSDFMAGGRDDAADGRGHAIPSR